MITGTALLIGNEEKLKSYTDEKGDERVKFEVVDGCLYKNGPIKSEIIANFYLKIVSRTVLMDENQKKGELIDIDIIFENQPKMIRLTGKEFHSGQLIVKIMESVGPRAILYGSRKDLVIAAKTLSDKEIPVRIVRTSAGLHNNIDYFHPHVKIDSSGVQAVKESLLDLSGGKIASGIGFGAATIAEITALGYHLRDDFLKLKGPEIVYPFIGHVFLAPFTSAINPVLGVKKPALHLRGSSGSGKTMLASLAMSFFGDFQDHFMSWASTANAIEREGFFFRDSLYLVDDLKRSVVNPETAVRILQNYVDGQGRARILATGKAQDTFYIRGLLLSTGEDFVDGVESINGRTIVLHVDPGKNVTAGRNCLKMRHLYKKFMPGYIHSILSIPNWEEILMLFYEATFDEFKVLTEGLSNGLRVASNWTLNALGFECFLRYMELINIINKTDGYVMRSEYVEIIKRHLECQMERLAEDEPASIMFQILQQKISAGQVMLANFKTNSANSGRVIGVVAEKQSVVQLYPDLVMEILSAHYGALKEDLPFAKNALRNSLVQSGLLEQFQNGRYTRQVRGEAGRRFNIWEFRMNDFFELCGLTVR